jgi:hypothetical protein
MVKLELVRWITAEVKFVSGATPGTEICERKCIKLLTTDYMVAHPISYTWAIKKSIYKKKTICIYK